MKFSVLMSIYHKENPDYFNDSMISIWDEQSVKPNEIILVQDGAIPKSLKKIIQIWKNKLNSRLVVIELPLNVGLGKALNIGLRACSNEIVARMDTDDISKNDRFELQLNILKNRNVDICSGWVSEFSENKNIIDSYRKVPVYHNQILTYSTTRNPINHPAVMYKKSFVEKSGGYMEMLWLEDYYLWVRMIRSGARFYNIPICLVNMRAGYHQLQRRSGYRYALSEFRLQKEFFKLGHISFYKFVLNILSRSTLRILPLFIIRNIYRLIRR